MKKQLKTNTSQPDIKKRRRKYVLIISAVAVLLAAVLLVGTAFSWFSPPSFNEADADFTATDFTAKMLVSHNDGGSYETLNTNKTEANNRVYVVGTGTSTHKTDIEKKRLKINYKGDSSAYLKVTLYESWYYGAKVANAQPIPDCKINYTLAKYNNEDFWVYNESDGCFYSKKPVSAYSSATGSAVNGIDIPFVSLMAADSSVTHSAVTYFDLVAVIEQVQPDRYDEFFGTSYEDVFGTD